MAWLEPIHREPLHINSKMVYFTLHIHTYNGHRSIVLHRNNTLHTFFITIPPQEGQLSYEEAIIAKKKYIEENYQLARKFRDESEELMARYFEQCKEEQLEMRRLVEATTKGHQNTQLMREKLTAMKRRVGWCQHLVLSLLCS